MGIFEATMLMLAGVAAGTMNTVVGAGSLVTFPVMLAFGYAPLAANMTNNVGVLPGGLSGIYALRSELAHQWPRALRLSVFSLVGGTAGALLLLALPAAAFKSIVPVLVGLAVVLVIIQPWLREKVTRRTRVSKVHAALGDSAIFMTGIYGGYFGAAQGVLLMSILGAMFDETIQKINSIKMVLGMSANLAATAVFIVRGGVVWEAAGAIAFGSIIGGQLGAHIGRRLPANVYRAVIVAVGVIAIIKIVSTQ